MLKLKIFKILGQAREARSHQKRNRNYIKFFKQKNEESEIFYQNYKNLFEKKIVKEI